MFSYDALYVSDVNKDWTCKDKDKDFTFYSLQGLARTYTAYK